MHWITEENYAQLMQTEAEPYLAARRESGLDSRVEGEAIYFEHYRADAPKGVIVISHGFTESVAKFTESIYYMLQAGYEVWGFDQRGHGRSFRRNDNPYVVHADRFRDYILDLKHLTETRVKPAAGGLPVYLFCHSMGGCVGALTMERWPELFDKAVLSSPMLGLSFGKLPPHVVYAVMTAQGIPTKGQGPTSPVEAFPEERFEDSAATSEPRFRYYYEKKLADPKLQTCAASTNWVREAIRACSLVRSKLYTAKLQTPVLLFQAGKDTFVKNSAQDVFASRVKGCRLVRVPEARHEIYMSRDEVLFPYWEQVFAFLAE
jgi:lysophospholipase